MASVRRNADGAILIETVAGCLTVTDEAAKQIADGITAALVPVPKAKPEAAVAAPKK